MPPPLPIANTQLHSNAPGQLYAPTRSSPDEIGSPSDGEPESPVSSRRSQEREVSHPDQTRSRVPQGRAVPVIDPSLEASETHSNGKSPLSLAITSAAVQAVLDESRRMAQQQAESAVNAPGSREPSPHTYAVSKSTAEDPIESGNSNVAPESPAGGNPPSTMFTEDGEAMLHPGE
jgi:hypothetical protein